MMKDADSPTLRVPTRLADYRPPAWLVDSIALEFELDFARTTVRAKLAVRRNPVGPGGPLVLDGEHLHLRSVKVDGVELQGYEVSDRALSIELAGDTATIDTVVTLDPSSNTALEGLYRSGEFLLTQCEAQGFRRITYFPDRPDVMTRYTTTLAGSRDRFPVLLGNGNPAARGDLPNGRHFATWVDPFPKPSYLFALVAGRLEHIEERYTTSEGRDVTLRIYAEPDAIGRCRHAMDSLIASMRWDEERFGRPYDLDVYNIVATNDFNMGAMENKGLNIFNAKFIVADAETATDADFKGVEAVVAHEYFHNWTGNRITCRDWFQLSLKEGLTVFRDQEFSSDLNSRAVKRIEDVRQLRMLQFPEDAGPFAHPVRPESYVEINNFYTATVYEKGAEVVRLYRTMLGEDGFRRGMDLYFERHDGQAITCEDYVRALGDANGVDLTPFLAWYAQAGTPHVRMSSAHEAAARRYTLTLAQSTPTTPGQSEKKPLPMPVRLMLYRADGSPLPLRLAGESQPVGEQRVVLFDQTEQSFVFEDIDEPPVASVFQDFSAPVQLHREDGGAALEFLAAHDRDPFNRWDAIQKLGERAILGEYSPTGADADASAFALVTALKALLSSRDLDEAFIAECLALPDEIYLGELVDGIDPERMHQARESIRALVANAVEADLLARFQDCANDDPARRDGEAMGRRRLKNLALGLLVRLDPQRHAHLAERQYASAGNMTDRLAALTVLVHNAVPGAQAAADAFYERFHNDPLVVDKWLTVQATNPQSGTLERAERLSEHPAFTLRNPNKVRALLTSFARSNRVAFHAAGGAGYRFIGGMVLKLDALNPQAAARLAAVFNGWRKLEPVRRAAMRAELERMAQAPSLSPDLGEIVQRALA